MKRFKLFYVKNYLIQGQGSEIEFLVLNICNQRYLWQALFDDVVTALRNGGKRANLTTQLGYTKEQVETIQRLKQGTSDYEKMGIPQGSGK